MRNPVHEKNSKKYFNPLAIKKNLIHHNQSGMLGTKIFGTLGALLVVLTDVGFGASSKMIHLVKEVASIMHLASQNSPRYRKIATTTTTTIQQKQQHFLFLLNLGLMDFDIKF